MEKLIRKILREEIDKSDRHYRRLDIISDHVQLPYFKSMVGLTIYDKDDQLYIMKKILGNDIYIGGYNTILHYKWGKEVYVENDDGSWWKTEYDDKGSIIYEEDSEGGWGRFEYDDKGKMIYEEYSFGIWTKWEYDDNGNRIYYEQSSGHWKKTEWDDNGYMLYYETSEGDIIDNR